MKKTFFTAALFALGLLFTSCEKNKIVNELTGNESHCCELVLPVGLMVEIDGREIRVMAQEGYEWVGVDYGTGKEVVTSTAAFYCGCAFWGSGRCDIVFVASTGRVYCGPNSADPCNECRLRVSSGYINPEPVQSLTNSQEKQLIRAVVGENWVTIVDPDTPRFPIHPEFFEFKRLYMVNKTTGERTLIFF